jgi:hypothetical protein
LASFKETATKNLREEVKKNLNLATDGKPAASMLTMLETASYEVLVALNDQYKVQAESKMPLTCSDCGSHKVSRASSTTGGSGGQGEGGNGTTSLEEVKEKLAAKQRKSAVAMHGAPEA